MDSNPVRPIMRSAVLLAVFASTACTTMKTVTMDQLAGLGPVSALVTKNDETVVLLWEPKFVRDTLVGYVGKHREKLPGNGVKQVRVRTSAPTRTAALAVGLAAGLTGVLVLAGGTGENAIPVSSTGPPGLCDINPDQYVCTGVPE